MVYWTNLCVLKLEYLQLFSPGRFFLICGSHAYPLHNRRCQYIDVPRAADVCTSYLSVSYISLSLSCSLLSCFYLCLYHGLTPVPNRFLFFMLFSFHCLRFGYLINAAIRSLVLNPGHQTNHWA